MKNRKPYIMHDQVRNQVSSIMAWKPHRAGEEETPIRLHLLISRWLQRAADACARGFQPTQHAHS